MVLHPFITGVYPKRKELAPFSNGTCSGKPTRKSQVISHVKMVDTSLSIRSQKTMISNRKSKSYNDERERERLWLSEIAYTSIKVSVRYEIF